jgi:hypothetical protein
VVIWPLKTHAKLRKTARVYAIALLPEGSTGDVLGPSGRLIRVAPIRR